MNALIQDSVGDIPKNGHKYFTSDGLWSMFELIGWVLGKTQPMDVRISSFSISEESVRYFLHLRQIGLLGKLEALLDPSLRRTKTPQLCFAAEVFDTLRFLPNHSKIILMQGVSMQVCILSSANLGRNRRMEAGVIDTRTDTFEFFHQVMKQWMSIATPL